MTSTLKPEDYLEPQCLLCGEAYGMTPEIKPVPQTRIIERMNALMAQRDYAGAERHLLYWLEEAVNGHDDRGRLMLYNELIGHYRKTGEREKSLKNAEAALSLLNTLEFEGTISSGTTYVNAATAFHAFGEYERARELFEKARSVYEADGKTDKALLGGLYNNMALNLFALGKDQEALLLYQRALDAMAKVENGHLEQAVTFLNMADVYEKTEGPEAGEAQIYRCLDQAYDLLIGRDVQDAGYYAFVLEKCAPVFEYYGYFLAAQDLNQRAAAIYERSKNR